MRAHFLQHVPFEGLGSIRAWLEEAGYRVTFTQLFDTMEFPDLSEVHLLIVLGGPMSVNDEARFPWLAKEKQFIRNAIGLGRPVLGICLGAQLIASALGARVYRNATPEIGWFPVEAVAAEQPTFQFPRVAEVFHWHGETFDLPPGTIHLARSAGCENQAFQIGRTVIGLQFHLETTSQSACELVAHCADELVPAPYVQSEAEILSAPPEKYEAINALMSEVLAFLTRRQLETGG